MDQGRIVKMNITLHNLKPAGTIAAIPSKSHVHRLLIAAALSERETVIKCDRSNDDIDATVRCLNALGAHISFKDGLFSVQPIRTLPKEAVLEVGESGSTLRFMLPVAAALGITTTFKMKGRLPSRPLSPLMEEMIAHGVNFWKIKDTDHFTISGKMHGGNFTFDGGISSQFTTGLLLAMARIEEESSVTLTGKVESRPYIDLTLRTLRTFGFKVTADENTFSIGEKSKHAPSLITAEGDWSNAAFMLALGAFSDKGVNVSGLDFKSAQGDRAVFTLIDRFQGNAVITSGFCGFKKGEKDAVESIDAANIPDLVPILSVLAASAVGTTVIENCGRLRLKESDRIASVCAMINSLGGDAHAEGDSIVINGTGSLRGGTVDSANDHRIAMSAAVASVICSEPVTITGAQAVRKSYPLFFDDLGALCGQKITLEDEPKEIHHDILR